MNKYINILNNSNIYVHQIIIKDIILMKRESKNRYHFSFGEYFDERMMIYYCIDSQIVNNSIHQIIVFSSITKSTRSLIMNGTIQELFAVADKCENTAKEVSQLIARLKDDR